MTKIGLKRSSALKKQPKPDEQTQMLFDYGVPAENIHESVDSVLTEVLVGLLEDMEAGTDEVPEIVVSSPSSLGTKISDLLQRLSAIKHRGCVLPWLAEP